MRLLVPVFSPGKDLGRDGDLAQHRRVRDVPGLERGPRRPSPPGSPTPSFGARVETAEGVEKRRLGAGLRRHRHHPPALRRAGPGERDQASGQGLAAGDKQGAGQRVSEGIRQHHSRRRSGRGGTCAEEPDLRCRRYRTGTGAEGGVGMPRRPVLPGLSDGSEARSPPITPTGGWST